MNYTKNCLLPWSYMLIHAGGLMQTCPCASDIEIGDFLLDYIEKRDENPDIFNRESLQMVRKGLLTGNLRKMCRDCAYNTAELITTDELKQKVIQLLQSVRKDYQYQEGDDLTKQYAYTTIGVGFSNRCNLRCLYCNQSVCADTNPFYKAEFPYEYARIALEYFVNRGVKGIIPSVEGEITIYPHWYELYSEFHRNHPEISLAITTNLNREYSDEEIELLARHNILDVSCDSLDPEVYSKIRVNGRLDLLLKNLTKIKAKKEELHIQNTVITIHIVVCNLSWESLEEVSEYAFENGFGLNIGNYEERANARGYREHLLCPISQMSGEVQEKVSKILNRIRKRAEELGLDERHFVCHGDIIERLNKQVDRNYHRFEPVENICYQQFYKENPKGSEVSFLDIVYDDNNIAYTGIHFREKTPVVLNGLANIKRVVVREVLVYKEGKHSPKFDQRTAPGYRRVVTIEDGTLEVIPQGFTEDIDSILVTIEPLREKDE